MVKNHLTTRYTIMNAYEIAGSKHGFKFNTPVHVIFNLMDNGVPCGKKKYRGNIISFYDGGVIVLFEDTTWRKYSYEKLKLLIAEAKNY